MNLFEDFTRCDCGNAYFKKEVRVLINHTKKSDGKMANLIELSEGRETRYVCDNCNNTIHIKRE